MTSIVSSSLFQSLSNGALLVTANRRLARAFVADFNQRKISAGETSWQTPDIIPLDAWWQMLHTNLVATGSLATRLLTDEQEHALWIRSIEESGDQGVLLSVTAAARELMKSWRTEHAYTPVEDPWSHYLNDDQRAYRRWSGQFEKFCDESGFIDAARLPSHVFVALADLQCSGAPVGRLLPTELIMSGFSHITPQLQAVLEACKDLGVKLEPQYHPETVNGKVMRTACADTRHELRSAAMWARQQLASQHCPNAKFAVVIADLHLRRAEVERVFDAVFFPGATPLQVSQQGRPYELSLGQPLSRFAPVASALEILELGFDKLTGSAISSFLLSPFLLHAVSEKDRRSIYDSRLRSKGFRTVHLHQLLDTDAPQRMMALLKKMHTASSQSPALPSVWLGRVIGMLEAAGWPGEAPPQSVEFQAIEAWHDCMEDVVHLDELVGRISASRMLALFRQVSDSRVFQPQSPRLPIQVLGTLEAAGMVFDAIWLTGFDNENWPPLQRPSPFLPLKWQKSVAAPGASLEHELAVSRKLVESFQGSAQEVVLSYPQALNGNTVDVTLQIARLPEAPPETLCTDTLEPAMKQVFDSLSLETLHDHSGPAVDPANPVKGGTRLFEDQAKCPFRAFALHRLQASLLEEPPVGIDARDKGNFFHDTMELFWHETGSQSNLVALSEEELARRIRNCIGQSMHDNAGHSQHQYKSALFSIEKERLERIVHQWIHYFEKSRAPFTVEKMEEDEEVEFESLKLRLKLDRVDRLTDGGRVIIDYKTGRNNSISSWTDERITSAQLPLYAVVMTDIHAVCFAQVAVNKLQFLGMAKEKGLLAGLKGPANDSDSWPERLQSWRENLAAIAREIREGYAAVTPARSVCQFCELPSLCRIDDNLQIQEEGQNAGDSAA